MFKFRERQGLNESPHAAKCQNLLAEAGQKFSELLSQFV